MPVLLACGLGSARGMAMLLAAAILAGVAGAIRLAKQMGPGHTIVTVLCDYGTRYQTKLWNPAFLREKGLPVPHWLEPRDSTLPDVTEA